jgi:hypothetical protein
VTLAKSLEQIFTKESDFSFPETWLNWLVSMSQRIAKKTRALESIDGDIATGTLVVAALMALLLLTKFMLGSV